MGYRLGDTYPALATPRQCDNIDKAKATGTRTWVRGSLRERIRGILVPEDVTVQWEETMLALAEVGSSSPWWRHGDGA